MLDLHRLRLLQEFAARGSIARTAAVLGYTPSAVSQQLAALERDAGTALLDRAARLAAPAGEPSRQAVDRLLAAVGVTPPVLSEFEGMSTIVSLVARGIGIAILPGLAVAAADRRITVRDLPHGLDLARDVYAVARTASVRRPSVAVIVTALRAAGDRKSTRLNSSHLGSSYAVFCLKKKKGI